MLHVSYTVLHKALHHTISRKKEGTKAQRTDVLCKASAYPHSPVVTTTAASTVYSAGPALRSAADQSFAAAANLAVVAAVD